MSGEVEVVEVAASNTLVPNLTICIENENEAPVVEFDEIPTKIESEKTNTEVKFTNKCLPTQKLYENKISCSIGGDLDIDPQEAMKRRKLRAKRFASPLTRDQPDTQNDEEYIPIDANEAECLLKKVQEFNSKVKDDEIIRETSLNIYGVQDMSTDDIFRFLNKIPPKHIEWIDDHSCNVVWTSDNLAAKALMTFTKPNEEPPKTNLDKTQTVEGKEKLQKNDFDELDIMDSDDENDLSMEIGECNKNSNQETKKENPSVVENIFSNKYRECIKPFNNKFNKENYLKMRFATVADKKILGAGKYSKYYMKHGNPNYGGVKGILSRYHNRKSRQELDQMNVPFGGIAKTCSTDKESKTLGLATHRRRSEDYFNNKETPEKKQRTEIEDNSSESNNELEKEDEDLIKSSAKDLSDAIPCKVDTKSTESKNKTLTADTNKEKQTGDIWSRLGKKKRCETKITMNNSETFEKRTENIRNIKYRLGRKPHSPRNEYSRTYD